MVLRCNNPFVLMNRSLPRRSLPTILALPMVARAQPAELRIAALLPLTGDLGVQGDETCRGLELAADERGGPARFRVLRADAPDAAQGVAELRRLLAGERPLAVFGSVSSAIALATSQTAEAAGLPFFEFNAVAEAVTERGLRQVWRLGPSAAQFGALAATTIADTVTSLLGAPVEAIRVAIVGAGGLSSDAICDSVAASLAPTGVTISGRFNAPAGEMGHAVQRLRSLSADVLLHTGSEGEIAALFRAFRDEAWRPRLVLGVAGGHAQADTARAAGDGYDGTLVIDVPPVPPGHAFTDIYRRRYGAAPRSGHSLAAYSLARPVLDALRAPDLRQGMVAVDLPEGTLPNGWGLRMDARQQNTRTAPVLTRWESGVLSPP
jgi:branched-chain amino acid transport system substrate-binding protein